MHKGLLCEIGFCKLIPNKTSEGFKERVFGTGETATTNGD
jgi:hypothetical protein